jgi:autotransporter-associated beta strand protein
MAGYYSVWRISRTTLAILLAIACSAQMALAQYTFVQDTDGTGNWDDVLNWDTDNDPNTPNTTYPNGIGVTAQINQPIKSGVGGYTLTMPATDVTVGQLTIDNTNDIYATKITMASGGGRLIFEDSSGTAKYVETTGASTAPQNVQNSIQVPIWVKNTLEITENNYPNLNTGTIFTNRFDGDINSKIIKKGIGGIQFNLNSAPGAGQGFFGQILIQEGPIRLINKTFSISTVSGITVSNGGQLQLADNAGTAVPDYNMAAGAVLNLNGVGTNAPSSGPQGALRFGITSPRTTTFHNPVVLQTDSVISVGAAGSIGVIDQAVSGPGGLTKQGDGKLSLMSASNAWSGDTTVLTAPTGSATSVLSLANPTLADGRDVYLSATRTALDLTFTATDTIRALYFDGVAQGTGVWGATGSGAAHETSLITGTGRLNVVGLTVGVPGDFNNNGFVDAADYVLWRKGGPLANEVDNPGVVNAQDYVDWRARFGNPSAGSGSGLGGAAVPEPATFVLIMLIAPFFAERNIGRTRS